MIGRTFHGSAEVMMLSLGNLGFTPGAITLAGIAMLTLEGATQRNVLYIGAAGSGNNRYLLGKFTDTPAHLCFRVGANQIASPTITIAPTDGPCIIVCDKAAGTTTPNFHRCVLSTGVWTHEAAGGTLADDTGPPTTEGRLGNHQNAIQGWVGDILGGGVWNSQLSQSAIETLSAGWDAWLELAPTGAWLLNQVDRLERVYDWSGGGANETQPNTGLTRGSVDFPFKGPPTRPAYTDFPKAALRRKVVAAA